MIEAFGDRRQLIDEAHRRQKRWELHRSDERLGAGLPVGMQVSHAGVEIGRTERDAVHFECLSRSSAQG